MEDIFEMSLEELRAVFKNNKPVTDKVRYALSAMGIYSRSVEDASEMAGVIIEEMEENEFKGFLKASNSKTLRIIGQSEKIDCRASG